MSKSKTFTVGFKRKRKGKTNYKKRLGYIKSDKLRLVIRSSLKNIVVQIVKFNPEGDNVLFTAKSTELAKIGWKYPTGNIPAAYLTGLLLGNKAKGEVKEAITDFGLGSLVKKSKIYAALRGVLDSGINVPHSGEILPDDDQISGKKISDFAGLLSKDNEKYNKQFSKLLKNNVKPEDIIKNFEEVKAKVMKK